MTEKRVCREEDYTIETRGFPRKTEGKRISGKFERNRILKEKISQKSSQFNRCNWYLYF